MGLAQGATVATDAVAGGLTVMDSITTKSHLDPHTQLRRLYIALLEDQHRFDEFCRFSARQADFTVNSFGKVGARKCLSPHATVPSAQKHKSLQAKANPK